MTHKLKTQKTCSSKIEFELDGDIVKNVSFTGGCHGNLQAVSRLVEVMSVTEIETKLKGIKCGFRGTSCADQLSILVRKAYESELCEN